MHIIQKNIIKFVFDILRVIFDAVFKVEIKGRENIDISGGVLIVANHCSYLDIPVITRTFFDDFTNLSWVTSKDNFAHWFFKPWFFFYRIIVVNGVVEKARNELNQNRWVVIFPEGAGRWCLASEKPKKPGKGAAVLALSTGAPVVPVGIYGTDRVLPARSFKMNTAKTIRVHIGKPIKFEAVHQKIIDETLIEKTTQEIIGKIGALIKAED